ncbi:MAG: NAD(P)H-dependent oxidoreductase [Prevotellaceae bacterium]|jgi:chromate reductase|nr:NAD(P)H-dependent oxidoreductase [Prevotellaceae bacterium]
MKKKTIGVFVGSLRKDACSKKTANYIAGQLSQKYDVTFVELGNLCIFNQDFDDEGTTPTAWTAFREQVKNLDALLFVTPEYNRSIPGVLKNALDIASRPYGQNVWDGKPGAVVGVSPGSLGGALAVSAIKVPLSFLNVRLMMQPEVYVSNAYQLFDEQGNLTNESTAKFLNGFVSAFDAWIEQA